MPAGVVGELVVPAFLALFLVFFAWAYFPWPPTDFRENHDRSTNGITVVVVRGFPGRSRVRRRRCVPGVVGRNTNSGMTRRR